MTTVDREFLFGRWRLAPPAVAHAFHFAPWGELVHTLEDRNQRIVLTWRLEGDQLVTQEPSTQRTERTPIAVSGGGFELGTGQKATRYVRDSESEPFDRFSGQYALAAAALRHGFAQVMRGEPFEPFLLAQSGDPLELMRFHYPTPEAAEDAAKRKAESLPKSVRGCAWVYDAFITSVEDQQRTAAVMAAVSERRVAEARVFAQRYSAGGQLIGPIAVTGQRPGWLP